MVIIIDYGMGNLRSIQHKLEKMKIESRISHEPDDIARAERLILPGVGHFSTGVRNLRERGLIDVLNKRVLENNVPIMGICLGMQLFTNHSEEGDARGLGWISAVTRRFDFNRSDLRLRIPHIGWNTLQRRTECPFLVDVEEEQRFYFVHSYYVSCDCEQDIVATSHYGHPFVSVVRRKHIFGTQFHPEKSHRRGIELIRRFVQGGDA